MNEDLNPQFVKGDVFEAVYGTVHDAMYVAVDDAVYVDVRWDVGWAVDRAVHGAVWWDGHEAMSGAVWWAVRGPVHPNIDKFIEETEQAWS